ncbi:hypothetical protein G6F50_018142 [Rhizopus delemar]|uniref:Uncharacterized protein n=1 Tax=Rhizopus delemar TaxID=936053 RepID=A0A9P6XP26_9FUNG|nr:hypothetical protein G6F50_018142 [Rhizopus delemar]
MRGCEDGAWRTPAACWPPARATWPASRRPAASATPATCRGCFATPSASRPASTAARAASTEGGRRPAPFPDPRGLQWPIALSGLTPRSHRA